MYFNIVGSGSKGNATFIVENKTLILIDCGLPLVRLNKALEEIGFSLSDIDAVFFTHEHTDHVNGLKAISPKKMYATKGTLTSSLTNQIEIGSSIKIKDLTITAFKVSHDAKNPCGYVITSREEKMVYMTDTGMVDKTNYSIMKNPTYLMIESNHDISMLLHTNRPLIAKQRIMSEHGHLCNEDSAFAASELIGDTTKEIILAHISEEANTPECALETYKRIFMYKGINLAKYKIYCAPQWNSLIGGRYEH